MGFTEDVVVTEKESKKLEHACSAWWSLCFVRDVRLTVAGNTALIAQFSRIHKAVSPLLEKAGQEGDSWGGGWRAIGKNNTQRKTLLVYCGCYERVGPLGRRLRPPLPFPALRPQWPALEAARSFQSRSC